MGKQKTHEQFINEVKIKYGENYSVIGKYKNCMEKILIKHNLCDHEWYVTPNNFLRGYKCPNCYGNKKKTTEEFEKEVYNLTHGEYIILSTYENAFKKIKMQHNNNSCNHIFEIRPHDFLCGCRCPKCYKKELKTQQEFNEEIKKLTNGEYTVLGEYINNKTKIRMRHNCNVCNNYEWEVKPNAFLNGNRCPMCNLSKGEEKIKTILVDNNLDFETQFIFKDLLGIGNKPLRFDFALFDNKKQLKFLIEYDGEFHYKPIKKYKNEQLKYAEQRFEIQQQNDKLKNTYCENNKIKLLRIPYWEFDNIEEILKDLL